MGGPIEMTRQQLWDLVWSTPMREAAASIPMSSVGLKRVCSKHQVPVPPRAYWINLRAGRPIEQIPLPATKVGEQRIWVSRLRQKASADLPLAPSASFPKDPKWHRCTRNTRAALRQAEPDRRGALSVAGVGIAPVNVAPETVPRALAVLDTLIRAVERLSHSISMRSSPAALLIDGELVPVAISEKFDRNGEPADAAEMLRRKSYERRYPNYFQLMSVVSPSGWTHRPSGRLTITLSDGPEGGLRRQWHDGASEAVESRIDDVAAEAIRHAHSIGERRQRIERRRQMEGQERTEDDAKLKRVAFLRERTDRLDEAEKVTRLREHLRQTSDGYQSPKMFAFMQWSEAYVADLRESCTAQVVDRDVNDSGLW